MTAGGAAWGLAALLGGGCGGFGDPVPPQGAQYRFPRRKHDLLRAQPQALGVVLEFLPLGLAYSPIPGWRRRRSCQVLIYGLVASAQPFVPRPCPCCPLSPAVLAVDVVCVIVNASEQSQSWASLI